MRCLHSSLCTKPKHLTLVHSNQVKTVSNLAFNGNRLAEEGSHPVEEGILAVGGNHLA